MERSKTMTLVVLVSIGSLLSISGFALEGRNLTSYRELKYRKVVGQSRLTSCGPACLATVCRKFFGLLKSEGDFIRAIVEDRTEQDRQERGGDEVLSRGVSMGELREASRKCGISARAYQLPKEELVELLQDLRLPLILRLAEPHPHFVVALGRIDHLLALADPAWGVRVVEPESILGKWSGLILALEPPHGALGQARKTVQETLSNIRGRRRTALLAGELMWLP